jgi:NAD+ diphosphatase
MSRPQPPLARAAVDRAAHHRFDDDWLARAWAHPASRGFAVYDTRALVEGAAALVWSKPADLPEGERYFLGVRPEEPDAGYFAVAAPLEPAASAGSRAASLRDVGALLSDADAGLLAHASSLERWHARNPFCPQCGATTQAQLGGHARRCTVEGTEHHPRTDPAVIMLVTDGDGSCLLGHAPSWPARRMSTLAGFVEAGESLEHAVVREVAEEVGVDVGEVSYVGSQPWPFPCSLMLGFTARTTTARSKPRLDDGEISFARWFSRDEMRTAVEDGSLLLPMRSSIAFFLIQSWFGDDLSAIVDSRSAYAGR